jgi:hypothetical protein
VLAQADAVAVTGPCVFDAVLLNVQVDATALPAPHMTKPASKQANFEGDWVRMVVILFTLLKQLGLLNT